MRGYWAATGTLTTSRYENAGFGTPSAGATTGGYDETNALSSTEELDGVAWAAGGALGTARRSIHPGSCGTQTAGLIAAGANSAVSTRYNTSEEYDGASFAAGGNLAGSGRSAAAMSGTQTAGLLAFGYIAANTATSEEYDGAAWASGGTGSTARRELGSAGTQTASLYAGGYAASASAATESYNGASWTTENSLTLTRYADQGLGRDDTNAIICSGYTGSVTTPTVERFDGTNFAYDVSMIEYRYAAAAIGDDRFGAIVGGWNSGTVRTNTCYLYTYYDLLYLQSSDSTKTYSNFNWNAATDNYAWSFVAVESRTPTILQLMNNDSVGAGVTLTIKADKTGASSSYGTTGAVTLVSGLNSFTLSSTAALTAGTTYYVYMAVSTGTAIPPRLNYNNPGNGRNTMWRATASNTDPATSWFTADMLFRIVSADQSSEMKTLNSIADAVLKKFDDVAAASVKKADGLLIDAPAAYAATAYYAYAGYNGAANQTTTYKYTQSGDSWSTKAVATGNRNCSGCNIGTDKVYQQGGYTSSAQTTNYEYSASGDSWATKTAWTSTAYESNPAGFSIGIGSDYGYSIDGDVQATRQYSQSGNSWATKTASTNRRQALGNGTTSLAQGTDYGYMVAGYNAAWQTSMYRYSQSANAWDTRTVITNSRAVAHGSTLGTDHLYAVAGQQSGGGATATNYQYSDAGNSWATKTAQAANRETGGGANIGSDKVYSVGGDTPDSTNYEYSEVSDTWSTKTAMTAAKYAFGIAQL